MFFPENDHGFDLSLKNDVVLDDVLVEVDGHIFANDHLPLPPVFLLNHSLQSFITLKILYVDCTSSILDSMTDLTTSRIDVLISSVILNF